ncbi:uncharacterized protein LOC135339617 isoform X1 [Halichondria panicea]|uniref:uncharacterized protein LOC135339617 isoform X1 n=1 Tax=Halichondria panicea TaxID=6063 RepID=UPI00312B53DD
MSLGLLGEYGSSDSSDEDSRNQSASSSHTHPPSDTSTSHTHPPSDTSSSHTHPPSDTSTSHTHPPSDTTTAQESHYDPFGMNSTTQDDSSSLSSEQDHTPSPPVRQDSALPLPDLEAPLHSTKESSVFSNPYKVAEDERLSVLKHHVGEFTPEVKEERRRGRRGKRRGRGGMAMNPLVREDDDGPRDSLGRWKVRCGVGDTLNPPKKFMKLHTRIQSEEH